jgi:hypothetical protein
MPRRHTLFIVVSDAFCVLAKLSGKIGNSISLPTSTLVGLREPPPITNDRWGRSLQPPILVEIREAAKRPGRAASSVRVAGHVKPCFGETPASREASDEKRMRDRRFPDNEGELKKELGADLDVQVWGFHHDTGWSHIWKVLENVERIVEGGVTDEEMRGFESNLERAFVKAQEEAQASATADRDETRYEHLSAINHDILGLFIPLRFKLDNAAELDNAASERAFTADREAAAARSLRLRTEVTAALPAKLEAAQAMLNEFAVVSAVVMKSEWWPKASQMLAAPPGVRREEFWEWTVTLNTVLKNLLGTVTR